MFKKLLPTLMLCISVSSHAILLERAPQGQYNTRSAPVVDQREALQARITPEAPRANAGYVKHVYTYDNNMSEYLRDNLNLSKERADYAKHAASYLKRPHQLPELNSTFPVLEAEKLKGKE